MIQLSPSSRGVLKQYRINARKLLRRNLVGGHIVRQMGQSLDFHDFARYSPGDDIRHIDWQTTLRAHGPDGMHNIDNWLIRRFSAEEHFKMFISLDMRSTMRLPRMQPWRDKNVAPPDISRLQLAMWIAEALTLSVLDLKDEVIWHSLFEFKGIDVHRVRNANQIAEIYNQVKQVIATDKAQPTDKQEMINLAPLNRYLPPAGIWIILTDFYFTQETGVQLVKRVQQAQQGRRWIILIDLDSWNYERTLLAEGPRQIKGPFSPEKRLYVNETKLTDTHTDIEEHKNNIKNRFQRVEMSQWEYPPTIETLTDFQKFFEYRFDKDQELKRLFMRDL